MEAQSKLIRNPGYTFLTGIILFSSSLYLLAAVDSLDWMGIVTPLGVYVLRRMDLLATGLFVRGLLRRNRNKNSPNNGRNFYS
jgi:uncharacterized membrane protein YgdD (TMEM256/DUF423 family)